MRKSSKDLDQLNRKTREIGVKNPRTNNRNNSKLQHICA
jgi:hypothetical protein